MHNPVMLNWVKSHAEKAELILSVCTGALILARTGLLDGLEATTHFLAVNTLRELAPQTRVATEKKFTDNGRIITSAGVSAGIDMAFHVVEKM